MLQIPDINPILKGGIVGILVSVILALCGVIAWFIRNQTTTKHSHSETLRELRAGEKDAEFWQKDYDSRAAAQTKIIVEHLGKIRARLRDMDQKISNFEKEMISEFQQVRRDMATLARAIELKDRE